MSGKNMAPEGTADAGTAGAAGVGAAGQDGALPDGAPMGAALNGAPEALEALRLGAEAARERGGVRIDVVDSREQMAACWSVRLDVFVGEQDVPLDVELDDLDYAPGTVHMLAVDVETGADLGTGRLLRVAPAPRSGPGAGVATYRVGRMAVRREARGRHVGARIIRVLEGVAVREALEQRAVDGAAVGDGACGGDRSVAGDVAAVGEASPAPSALRFVLSSQVRAMGFYGSLGYEPETGETYLEANIPHQAMEKIITL